jgi:hypothetical protein
VRIAPSTIHGVYEPLAPLGVGIDSLYLGYFGDGLPHLIDPYHLPKLWRADLLEKVRKRELGL